MQTITWQYQSIDVNDANLYLVLAVWADGDTSKPPSFVEDITFVGLAQFKAVPVTDDAGRVQLADGSWVLPFVLDESSGDWVPNPPADPAYMPSFASVNAQLDSAVGQRLFALVMEGAEGDMTDPTIFAGGDDPDGWTALLAPLLGTRGSITA